MDLESFFESAKEIVNPGEMKRFAMRGSEVKVTDADPSTLHHTTRGRQGRARERTGEGQELAYLVLCVHVERRLVLEMKVTPLKKTDSGLSTSRLLQGGNDRWIRAEVAKES